MRSEENYFFQNYIGLLEAPGLGKGGYLWYCISKRYIEEKGCDLGS